MNQDTNTANQNSLNSASLNSISLNQPSFLSEIQTKVENKFASWHVAWLGKVVCSPIFWIELLLVAYVAITMPTPLPCIYHDTDTYTLSKVDLLQGYTDKNRTPVYPYFIKAICVTFGLESITTRNNPNDEIIGMHEVLTGKQTCLYVYYIQLFIWLLTLIPLYKAIKLLLHTFSLPFILTLYIGYSFLHHQTWILTEPLAISFSCLFFSIMIFYLKKPRFLIAIGISLFSLVMIMLRPAFLILLPLLIIFWIARFLFSSSDRLKTLTGFTSLLLTILLIVGYCELNKINHGFFGISSVGFFNQLNILVNTDFYKKGNNPEIINFIDNQEREPTWPWQVEIINNVFKTYGYNNTKNFTSQTIKDNFTSYLVLTIKRMYWEMELHKFQLFYPIGLLDFMIIVLLWIHYKTVPWTRLIIFLFFYTLLFGIYYGAQGEQPRLILPVLHLFYILCVRYIDMLFVAYSKPKAEFMQYLKSTL